MIRTRIEQKRPGEWYLVSDYILEDVPVPSWLVDTVRIEPHGLDDLTRALGKVYGTGRRAGREEGREEVKEELKALVYGD